MARTRLLIYERSQTDWQLNILILRCSCFEVCSVCRTFVTSNPWSWLPDTLFHLPFVFLFIFHAPQTWNASNWVFQNLIEIDFAFSLDACRSASWFRLALPNFSPDRVNLRLTWRSPSFGRSLPFVIFRQTNSNSILMWPSAIERLIFFLFFHI